jgi:hypothetical protein
MIKRYTMTWWPVKLDNILLWIMDIADPDFGSTWNEVAWSYWISYSPQIIFKSDCDNTDIIYLYEHPSAWPDEMYPIRPWETFQINLSYLKAMNIFYCNWPIWNLLYILAR